MAGLIRFFMLTLAICSLAASARGESIPWRMDPEQSVIEVEVHSTFDVFTCHVIHYGAQVAIARSTHQVENATIMLDLANVKTGKERRDVHLLEWSENARFSRVSFHLNELVPGVDGWLQARGQVTMHGVEKSVTFPVRSLVEGAKHSFDGETMLDYRDFGLPIIRKFWIVSVDPKLLVRFHLQGWLDGA